MKEDTESFNIREEANQATDRDLDRQLRPKQFEDFTGQLHVLDNLKVFVQAARLRGESDRGRQ